MNSVNDNLVSRFVQKSRIRVNPHKVNEFLDYHPSHPSLASFQDLFDDLEIENMTVRLSANDLKEVEYPMIAHLSENKGRFVLVESYSDDKVSYFDGKSSNKESVNVFEERWSGMALLLGTNKNLENVRPFSELVDINKWTILGSLIILAVISSGVVQVVHSSESLILWSIITSSSVVGLWLSTSLYKIENEEGSKLESRFCGKGEKLDCSSVVKSQKAKLFGFLSWSQLGVFFFGGQIVSVFFLGHDNNEFDVWNILSLFHILAFPGFLYSLYVQHFILKKWCSLCLITQTLIVINLMTFLLNGYPNFDKEFNLISANLVFLSFLISLLFLYFFVQLSKDVGKLKLAKRALEQFKADTEIFDFKLQTSTSKKFPVTRDDDPSVNKNKILLVLSPHCTPCQDAFYELKKLRKLKPDSFHLEYRLSSPYKDERRHLEYVKHFLALTAQEPLEEIENILDSIFSVSDRKDNYQEWMRNNPVLEVDEKILKQKIEEHNRFLQLAQISVTPTIYINGRKLPSIYRVRDLKYHF